MPRRMPSTLSPQQTPSCTDAVRKNIQGADGVEGVAIRFTCERGRARRPAVFANRVLGDIFTRQVRLSLLTARVFGVKA